jgi:hypothetical protein
VGLLAGADFLRRSNMGYVGWVSLAVISLGRLYGYPRCQWLVSYGASVLRTAERSGVMFAPKPHVHRKLLPALQTRFRSIVNVDKTKPQNTMCNVTRAYMCVSMAGMRSLLS